MFCRNCGNQVNDDDKFCGKCGFVLQENKNIKTEPKLEELKEEIKGIEYPRKKWITILLFLIPFTSFYGIHHFYNKRIIRGILYISLWFFWLTLLESDFISGGFLSSLIILIVFLYFLITDLIWIIKLPKLYFVKNKYSTKIIISLISIPVFLFICNMYFTTKNYNNTKILDDDHYGNKIISKVSRESSTELVKKMNLGSIEEEKFYKALDELGIYFKQIINVEKIDETNYKISLSNGKELKIAVKDDIFLSIFYLDNLIYDNGKVIKQIKEIDKQIEDDKWEMIEAGKKIKTNFKEITINSIDFKTEVHPPKRSGYYNYYKADNGQVYLHISTTIKNLEKRAIFCDEVMQVEVDYNNGYKYYAFSTVEDSVLGFTYSNITTIDPLTTQNIHYLISLPAEVESNTQSQLKLTFVIDNQEHKFKLR